MYGIYQTNCVVTIQTGTLLDIMDVDMTLLYQYTDFPDFGLIQTYLELGLT